jgi:hypothetical protein
MDIVQYYRLVLGVQRGRCPFRLQSQFLLCVNVKRKVQKTWLIHQGVNLKKVTSCYSNGTRNQAAQGFKNQGG